MVKIGLVDPETAWLKGSLIIKKEINASKTYCPRGRHAALAK